MIRRIDEISISKGNEGQNSGKMFDNSINLLSKEVGKMSEEIKNLEKMFVSRDNTTTGSIEQLFATLKTLSHNQTVLENKVDDALKNQLNTDVMVNSINTRMNHLSSALLNLSKAVPSGSQGGFMGDSPSSTANSAGNQSRPNSVRRGPGRPRKDGSVSRSESNGKIQVNPVKVSLPTGEVQVSKAKRYFIDPSGNSESVSVIKTEPSGKKTVPAIPVKRKRGRPPKKRTVEAVILNHQDASNTDEEQLPKTEEERDLDNREERQEEENHELPSQESAPTVGSALISPSLSASPPSMSRSSSPSTPIPNLIPSAAITAETTDIPEHEPEEVAQIPAENPIITTRIIGPLARKRLLGAAADSDNITIEMSSSSVAPDTNTTENNTPDMSRQQRELDKRRDAREKMLVNMKYNDREKAKSFMESNKQLLKAMREEERRKRMTALINAPPSTTNVQAQQYGPPPVTVTTPTTEFAFKTDEPSHQHKKIGISSMLNNEASALMRESEETLAHKRSNEDDDQDDYDDLDDDEYDDDDQQDTRLKKRRSSNFALSPSAPILEKSPSSEKENGGSNKRQEDQTSLLLASPIELLCRDGFFYQRDHPKVPITTGSYLKFKFKSKEEELVALSINQKDFIDSTRHERMNAHFLKPEIDVETEQAFTILSKTTLTEKYVNSLEYFLMEFRWENKLVGLGLKLKESKRTWQRRKALFTLFEFWRDQSREKRNFDNYTILHAVKEMENYRIFINRSVSWFYNHITLLKMILYDLCDNIDTQWREWMFNKGEALPMLGVNGVDEDNINEAIDNVLTLNFLDDGTENNQVKSSKVVPPKN
ncbi:hypothetical protein HG537_0E03070 [Torulaspora globosa]|uniref:Uncharacterized protein n=1 Tax=Torulaspora globosa TaxID=48254 RepID=A0A7H9HX39_9SACH|nr:hypothetical protein HG537_0E03070 [Torulaspora sp. CBS 2947]